MRGKRNEIINSNNLCRKKRELSKIKVKRHQKPAGRPPQCKSAKARARVVETRVEKHAVRVPGKVPLTTEQRFQCLPRREEDLRSHRTKQFVSAPTSSPNAAADLHCRVTPSPIGLKRSDSFSPKQARAERTAFNHESTLIQKRIPLIIRVNSCSFVVSPMEKVIVDLANALRERLAIIHDEQSRGDEAKHIARLRAVYEKIHQLQAALPNPVDPRLAHYLERKSYDKALEYLEG